MIFPLLSGMLWLTHYAPLIQRITSRIHSWVARVLSFAGRLQLIRSMLCSFQVCWASVFVLFVGVHLEVDKILRMCLWKEKEGRGGVKVAQGEVCLLFYEGVGLLSVISYLGTLRYFEDSLVVAGQFRFSMSGLGRGLHSKGEVIVVS